MPDFLIFSPPNLKEAFQLVKTLKPPHYYLAGGTDLVVKVKEGLIEPGNLIDLSRIAELKSIKSQADEIFIGSGVTHTEIASSELLNLYAGVLCQACLKIGSPQIRNRGTLGGNSANASPAADTIPALYTLEAKIILLSPGGKERTLPITEFFLGPGKTVLNPTELILGFTFPAIEGLKGSYQKLGQRKALAIAKVSLAVSALVKDGVLSRVRIALGAVAPEVRRAYPAEELLEGKTLTPEIVEAAKSKAEISCCPIDDLRSTSEYRSKMVGVLLERALHSLREG